MDEKSIQQVNIQQLEKHSIIAWIYNNKIKNEKGDLINFYDHAFLYDIYRDNSDNLVITKAAQVGASTLEIIKNFYDAKNNKMDIIYTLPTQADVQVFVGGKVNRIIAANPCMLADTKDKDTIEQKAVGQSMIYFRGTWNAKAAIMVTADRLAHDEKDSSKQDVIADYQARLQHSKFKQTHVFSHPSVPNNGVDVEWMKSDQKEWFIKCHHCRKEQMLSWNTEDKRRMSIDIEKKIFVCKGCGKELSDDDRRDGRWIARYEDKKWSGYHISTLMAPYISAETIVDKYNEVLLGKQTMDFFYNKWLGLAYTGGGNSVSKDVIMDMISDEENEDTGRIVIGVDTGVFLRYVIGNKLGLLGYGEVTDYIPDDINQLPLDQTLEYFLIKWPHSIMVMDKGGDIIGSRKLQKKYPGRVFLCSYVRDRKTQQLMRWGSKDEYGTVLADRNRMMQLVIDEASEKRFRLYNGNESDWYDYWLHWSHIYRKVEENTLGVLEYTWHRSDRDDWVHATVYWRIGVDKFGDSGFIQNPVQKIEKDSYILNPDSTVDFDPIDMFNLKGYDEEEDWRNV